MGYKYFQTDDRDDYFATLDRKAKERNPPPEYNVIDINGIILCTDTAHNLKIWTKKYFKVTYGQVKHGKWRDVLTQNNCTYELKTKI